MPSPRSSPLVMQPAARVDLAAAGPVEPSSSPDEAPGPFFKQAAAPTAPWEAMARHRFAAAICAFASGETGELPTLAFVPHIVVTGRYRMRLPADG